MWERPWSLKEGWIIGAGLLATGFLLQWILGPIDWALFAFPINLILLVAVLITIAAGQLLRLRVYLLHYLLSGKGAIVSIAYAALLTLLLGLIPQQTTSGNDPIGWTHLLASWPFVLIYLWMTLIVGTVGLQQILRLLTGKRTSLASLLSHVGLFIALVCGTLGHADRQKLRMSVKVGQPEWRAENEAGQVVELPLAIDLHTFQIEEYPMQALLIDNATGNVLTDPKGWQVSLTQTLEQAAPNVKDSLSLSYVEWHSVGAASAAYVQADNPQLGLHKEGWISCGSFAFPYHALKLDEQVSVVMPEREPKRFLSAVSVYTPSGITIHDTILVNKPLDVAGWKIYQLSYDERLGRWSDISVFELVRDPWLPAVYTGIFCLLVGAVLQFMRKEKKEGGIG